MGRPLKGRGSQKTCLICDPYVMEVRSLLLWGDGKTALSPGSVFRAGGFFLENMTAGVQNWPEKEVKFNRERSGCLCRNGHDSSLLIIDGYWR